MNILDYCNTFLDGGIRVDPNYQRTDKVWPLKAKQYLIETIVLGYPIPKLFLHQKIDIKSKKSIKFVVDGQQRTHAIVDFFKNKFPLSNTSGTNLAGKYYDNLDEDSQNAFLSYSLPIDLFITASREEIIETFRRINSYTVPLNAEEKRHANFQGLMKWYIYALARTYSESFTVIGTLTEKNLSRMVDFKFFSEMVLFLNKGQILTTSPKLLDKLYEENDVDFSNAEIVSRKLSTAIESVLTWHWLSGMNVVKPYIMQMIILAIANNVDDNYLDEETIKQNLSNLSEAIESQDTGKYAEFVKATSKTTNEKTRKEVIYKFVSEAIFS
ncbi:MAG: DUF262 domain-containing protein [Pseudomonadota bacterium]